MANLGNAGEVIKLSEAVVIVNNFRQEFPNEIKASIFDISLIRQIIDQPDCTQLKIYYGYDSNNLSPVLVGLDSNGSDMTSGIIVDRAEMCPPSCDIKSELMK